VWSLLSPRHHPWSIGHRGFGPLRWARWTRPKAQLRLEFDWNKMKNIGRIIWFHRNNMDMDCDWSNRLIARCAEQSSLLGLLGRLQYSTSSRTLQSNTKPAGSRQIWGSHWQARCLHRLHSPILKASWHGFWHAAKMSHTAIARGFTHEQVPRYWCRRQLL